MPELPDIVVYRESLESRLAGSRLLAARTLNPFVLRTAVPPLADCLNRAVLGVRRIGKRIVIALEGEYFVVLHLMIAGRLRWSQRPAAVRNLVAEFAFERGHLYFTEAGTRKRASLHVVHGEAALRQLDPGGLEVLEADREAFATRLRAGNHTLKRALTDPRSFSGIGNAYSDEILHRARLSPIELTGKLSDDEVSRLFESARDVLSQWTQRLRAEAGDGFPEGVTAFRPEMAVHGRYGKPCPVCAAPVQRIVYAENETNYCARCQTDGRVLKDRSLSRLLKASWPGSIDDL